MISWVNNLHYVHLLWDLRPSLSLTSPLAIVIQEPPKYSDCLGLLSGQCTWSLTSQLVSAEHFFLVSINTFCFFAISQTWLTTIGELFKLTLVRLSFNRSICLSLSEHNAVQVQVAGVSNRHKLNWSANNKSVASPLGEAADQPGRHQEVR